MAIRIPTLRTLKQSRCYRRLHIGEVKIVGYPKTVRIEKDGSLNLNLMLEPVPAKPGPTNAPPSTASAPWTLSVDEVEDQKPAKPATLSLDQLAFNVKGFSTVSNELITASLWTRLNQADMVTVQGKANYDAANE